MQTNWTADEIVRSAQAPGRPLSDIGVRAFRKTPLAIILFVVIAAGLLAAIRLIPVVYESTGTLAITPPAAGVQGPDAQQTPNTSVDAVVAALNSADMHKQVAAEIGQRGKIAPEQASGQTSGQLDFTAHRRAGTYLVDITARAATADGARETVEAALAVFEQSQLEQLASKPVTAAIPAPAESQAVQDSRKRLSELQAERNRLASAREAAPAAPRSSASELASARSRLAALQDTRRSLEIFIMPGDAQLNVDTLRASGALDRLGARGANIRGMVTRLATADPQDAAARTALLDQILSEAIWLNIALEGEVKELDAQVSRLADAPAAPPPVARPTADLSALDARIAAERALLEQLSAAEPPPAKVGPAAQLTSRVVAQASPGEQPLLSRHSYLDIAAVALALLLSIAFVIGSAFWSDTVLDARDAAALAGAPAVAMLPKIAGWKLRRLPPGERRPSNYALEHPTSPFTDALRETLSMIRLRQTSGPLCLVVAGSQKGDGSTTLALCLGRTASAGGQRVLLVDADLDAGGLTKAMNIDVKAGLEALLEGVKQLPDLVVEDPLSGAHLLPAACDRSAQGALSLTKLNAFKSALAQAASSYDLIIIDSHPQGVRSRSWPLSRMADAAIVVVAHDASSRMQVRGLARRLRQGGARIRGLVMNLASEKAQRTRMAFQVRGGAIEDEDDALNSGSSEVIQLPSAR